MMKLLLTLFFISTLYGEENTVVQQNVLFVSNMIQNEEKIAHAYEAYLLKEFAIPTMEKLVTNDYLGENFSLLNRMGKSIDFNDAHSLKLKYALSKRVGQYLFDLYNRSLHRNKTAVKYIQNKIDDSYVLILLSPEAQTIYNILQDGQTIAKTCDSTLKNQYCNNAEHTIRWYNENQYWIEYNKSNFDTSNVSVENASVLEDTKLQSLPVGTYIRVQNGSRYVKVLDNKILVVE